MAKVIAYGEEARKSLQAGIDKLADTVKSPWAPKAATWFWIKIRRSADHQRRRHHRQGDRAA